MRMVLFRFVVWLYRQSMVCSRDAYTQEFQAALITGTRANVWVGIRSKRRQTDTLTTKTSTNQNVETPNIDKPKRRQAKTSTDQNVDKPILRLTKTSTDRNVDSPF